SSRCDCNSSSISRLSRSPRSTLVKRDQSDISHRPQNMVHSRSHCLPACLFGGKLLPARRGQFIDSSAATALFGDPFGANPPGFFHPVKRWIEGTFLGAEYVAGYVLNGGHDGVAMRARPAGKDFQDQQVERPLERIGFRHTVALDLLLYRRLS